MIMARRTTMSKGRAVPLKLELKFWVELEDNIDIFDFTEWVESDMLDLFCQAYSGNIEDYGKTAMSIKINSEEGEPQQLRGIADCKLCKI